MTDPSIPPHRRILIVDDNEAIHQDFRKILNPASAARASISAAAAEIFGQEPEEVVRQAFEIDSAFQGREGLEKVRQACGEGRPYAMAFVDIRMPPGWDGVETVKHIWSEYPELQVVICTAYSDYSLDEIVGTLGRSDRMLVLKKPFDAIEVLQLADSLTEKWRLAHEVRGQVQSLEARVEERTRELHERQQQLMLARKMEVVGRLAGGIAHDFNSYLTAIIGHADLIRQEVPVESLPHESAVEIGNAAMRAATLTRQLLVYSRKQMLKPELLDVNAVASGLDSALREAVGPGVEIFIEANAGAPWMLADASQLRQAILSLAHNARDAMPKGGTLTIETANVTVGAGHFQADDSVAPGDYVTISVTDTGSGIPDEVKEHLFEPFFTTKPQGDGRGLSLAMCYGILKQSHGHISVSSEPGKGASFRLYLPRTESSPEAAHAAKDDNLGAPHGMEVILLVEQDAALRDFSAAILERHGYTVCFAGGSRLAMSTAGRLPRIDLLISNAAMPEMTGRELADWISSSHPDLKVLLTTASDEEDAAHRKSADANTGFMRKPYSPEILSSTVRATLDSTQTVADVL